jgi:UDP-N-acetylglucosamine diphosphorylase / glucose-1-phosphate thymidylyltransferase / UDP-N-acetylgalactosamine diphosphorylase / glucosamine-1-phosphate N-acetyltransferase / galactosamine-1-phosphate N-acetyltransferase
MKLVIPMAGLGTRFAKVSDQNEEYKKPKPFINVKGYPMIRWATGSLPFVEHPGQKVEGPLKVLPKDIIFIILKKHDDEFNMERQLKDIYSPDVKVVILEEVTRGAAETAYQAKPFLPEDEDVIFSDSDHFFDGSNLAKAIAEKSPEIAGIIPVFSPPNDGVARWSYSLLKPGSQEIIQVGEKDPELMKKGAPANIGAYYFSQAGYFLSEVEEVMEKNEVSGPSGKGEFYIAPLYQRLLNKGMKLRAAILPEVWGLGTPEDLESFLKNCPISHP